ncbi:MAG TPA: CHAT domain-containing protein [Thermoanaerobaculia bacterium]|nr:CHAT domain-containing protein [Thermoanaerobaculia bacterium]
MNIRRRYDEPDTPLLLRRYIGDNAAAALMNDFYCHLLMGDSAGDVLRYAQLPRGDFSPPSQWAAFTLAGKQRGTEATEH